GLTETGSGQLAVQSVILSGARDLMVGREIPRLASSPQDDTALAGQADGNLGAFGLLVGWAEVGLVARAESVAVGRGPLVEREAVVLRPIEQRRVGLHQLVVRADVDQRHVAARGQRARLDAPVARRSFLDRDTDLDVETRFHVDDVVANERRTTRLDAVLIEEAKDFADELRNDRWQLLPGRHAANAQARLFGAFVDL